MNWLHRNLPVGLVVDAAWLERHGYSRSLRSQYVKSGWLDQPGRGAYQRPPAFLFENKRQSLLWQNVLVSLQTLLDKPVVLGGRTALELQGLAHFVSSRGPREVHVYSNEDLPGWVARLPADSRFVFHKATKLFRSAIPAHSAHPPKTSRDTRNTVLVQPWGPWNWPLVMSTPERAVLELLDEVPHHETFEQADKLIEGLHNLSPRRLRFLLLDCRSIKVKRLFLWFAERHNHPWLKRLDRAGIDLGSGKRMLVRGGKLDARFNITVPDTLDARV